MREVPEVKWNLPKPEVEQVYYYTFGDEGPIVPDKYNNGKFVKVREASLTVLPDGDISVSIKGWPLNAKGERDKRTSYQTNVVNYDLERSFIEAWGLQGSTPAPQKVSN